jgi:hypothetical protein
LVTKLSDAGKDQVALALLLLKDFKTTDVPYGSDQYLECMKMVLSLADHLGVSEEFSQMLSRIPPMAIRPK